MALNWYLLCQSYTLAQIEEKIAFYLNAIEEATVSEYSKDTSQGSQRVKSAEIEALEEILNAWLKAKDCKTGGSSGGNIVSADYRSIDGRNPGYK